MQHWQYNECADWDRALAFMYDILEMLHGESVEVALCMSRCRA